MLQKLPSICVALLGLMVSTLGAEIPEPRPLPEGGTTLLPADPLPLYGVQSQLEQVGEVKTVDLAGTPHGKVVRVELRAAPKAYWDAQVKWRLTGPVAKDQAMIVRVLIRATAGQQGTASGKAELGVQLAKPPWSRLAPPVAPSLMLNKWVWIDMPMVSAADRPAGETQITLNLGYFQQTLEVADVQAYAFPMGITAKSLPQPDCFTYVGREADAPWRAAAEARIEQHRKADITVRVLDAGGNPVRDADVSIRMKRHTFLFGTCVNETLLGDSADSDRYREEVKKLFNIVVHEGAMKWGPMAWQGGFAPDARRKTPEEQQQQIAKTRRYLDWTEANGIKTRGHTLVWPGWGGRWALLPPYLKPMVEAGDKEGVRREVEQRIRTAAGAFKGRLVEWDVVNETVDHHVLQDLLGREEIAEWFRLAKESDPAARTVINDYCMLSGGAIPARIEAFYEHVRFLLDQGAPIDAIGEQAHFAWDLPGIDQTYRILERFAGFGLPLRITEYDVSVTDEQLQADYTRDFYTIAFSHPKVQQILMWGFWEGNHWQPHAAMLRRDWTPKPNYEAYRDLVFNKWWTNVDARSDEQGKVATRGFLGDYEIAVSRGEQKVIVPASLDRDGQALTVRLP